MMDKVQLLTLITKQEACQPAKDWLTSTKYSTFTEVWNNCPEFDWLLWLVDKVFIRMSEGDKTLKILLTADIAALALPFLAVGEERPRLAIEASRTCSFKKGSL